MLSRGRVVCSVGVLRRCRRVSNVNFTCWIVGVLGTDVVRRQIGHRPLLRHGGNSKHARFPTSASARRARSASWLGLRLCVPAEPSGMAHPYVCQGSRSMCTADCGEKVFVSSCASARTGVRREQMHLSHKDRYQFSTDFQSSFANHELRGHLSCCSSSQQSEMVNIGAS